MNCQLQRNVPGCTGKWSMTQKADNGHGERVLELMREHGRPIRGRWAPPSNRNGSDGSASSEKKHVCNVSYIDKDKRKRPSKKT